MREEYEDETITSGGIYNQITKARLDFLNGRSPIEALIEIVSGEEYFSNYRMKDLAVESVFFMHQESKNVHQIRDSPTDGLHLQNKQI